MIASVQSVVEALRETRERTLGLVEALSDQELAAVHSPLMSPLAWDLAHIAAFEDLWLAHRLAGRPLLRADLAATYDAFETPRAQRGDIELLDPSATREYLDAVRERVIDAVAAVGVGDGTVTELVLRHEQQHTETMLQTLQLAGLDGYRGERPPVATGTPAQPATGLELVEVPGGECTLGAAPAGFAYDNERPRHRRRLDGFRIGRTAVTNASWLAFVEGGGYQRREWWSDEGWAWKEQYDITRPGGWSADLGSERRLAAVVPIDPERPVVHVSWFEADAFARAHGLRLPTEAEWEKAATWDHRLGEARLQPWGEDPLVPGVHANVDQLAGGPTPAQACLAGASPYGCLGMIGDVWEWTASEFEGYPGFAAHPYREYSEVFFGGGYYVLRGGSWATRDRTATATFRNWDFPQRRQIFAGLRVACNN